MCLAKALGKKCRLGAKGGINSLFIPRPKMALHPGMGKSRVGDGSGGGESSTHFHLKGFAFELRKSRTSGVGFVLPSPLPLPPAQGQKREDTDGWAVHSLIHSTHPFIKMYLTPRCQVA